VDFRQIVNFRMVKQEASLLHKSLTPLLELDARFADLILVDLAKVVQLCGRASGQITSGEILAFLLIYALIKKDKEKLDVALNSWEFSEVDRTKYEKLTLQILLDLTQNQPPNQLTLPSLLNQLDSERNSNYLEKAVNAIYKFAQVIVKADGEISMQEMEALSQIWQMLHSYQSVNNYQTAFTEAVAKIPPLSPASQSTNAQPVNTQSVTPQPVNSQPPPSPPSSQNISVPAPSPAAANATIAAPASEAPAPTEAELTKILDQALAELNDLVGLNNIKEEVKTLANFLKVQKIRQDRGLAKTSISLHSVFCGPPGTGKTTVARLISRIYQGLGFLKKGHLVETDRSGMVAGYIGKTAEKVDNIVNSALDGVLFIDEAYALVPKDAERDFGQEAIDILLKRMEDYRDRLVVIVAGYTDEMTRFIESNPGLKSRFNRYFYFDDYKPDELLAIFESMASKSHFKLTSETRAKLLRLFEELYVRRDRTFGNARVARNLFEKSIERQANRLAVLSSFTDEVLTTLLPEDIPAEAVNTMSGEVNWQELASSKAEAKEFAEPFARLEKNIADRLRQGLQTQNITVNLAVTGNSLSILVAAKPIPDEAITVELVQTELAQLRDSEVSGLDTIDKITIYGQAPLSEMPSWSEEFEF